MTSQDGPEPMAFRERAMIEAVLDEDQAAWQAASSQIEAARLYEVITVATTAAVFRRWPTDPSMAQIADYVEGLFKRLPADAHVAPAVVEAVVRGSLGDSAAVRGTSVKDIIPAQLLLLQAICRELIHTAEERENFLAEVIAATR